MAHYTKETLIKLLKKSAVLLRHYGALDPREYELAISDGNRKIGRVMNVSLMPLVTCGPACRGFLDERGPADPDDVCDCPFYCYDVKACLQYVNVLDARCRNTALLCTDRDEYFRRIDERMNRRRKNKFFRWHVAGEIPDLDYLARMIENARRHPDFTIWTYTKRYDIVNEYCRQYGRESIPENLSIMFSEWKGKKIVNPYHFPVFRCVMPGEEKPRCYRCPGNCDACKAAHRGCIKGEDTYNDLH